MKIQVEDLRVHEHALPPLQPPGYALDDKPPKPPAKRKDHPKQGHALELEDPEAWPEAVDGARLLDALGDTFRAYVVLPTHADAALSLWVLLTYSFDAFYVAPKLAITSPLKRCGKTQLLILISALTPRALPVSNITAAALFRTIQKFRPTLLIDEADTFVRNDDDLRGIIDSGHTRRTAIVIRNVGDDHEPRIFSTWCPQAIALIGKLSDTIADRSIHIRQQRRTRIEAVRRLRQDRIDGECETLRRQAARWTADHAAALTEADPDVPESLNDRAQDCWRPLLAIADQVGGEWPRRARMAAIGLSGVTASTPELSVELLFDIRSLLTAAGTALPADIIPSAWLREKLLTLEGRPWPDLRDGRPLSAKRLAALLAEYEIVPTSDGSRRGYRQDAFLEAFSRYLPPESAINPSMCQNPNNDGPNDDFSMCQSTRPLTHAKTPISSMTTGLVDALTDRNADPGPDPGSDDDGLF